MDSDTLKDQTNFIDNTAPCPTIIIDLSSQTIKGGFAGELSPCWEILS